MPVSMHISEQDLIRENLRSTDKMLEWGRGGSTLEYSKYVADYYSIEHDKVWYDRVMALKKDNVHYYLIPMSKEWHGESDGSYEQFKDYVDFPKTLGIKFDVVLVDGRCREGCLKSLLSFIDRDTKVFVHDRKRYTFDGYKVIKVLTSLAYLRKA